MKKLLIFMAILMIGLTLSACDGTADTKVIPSYSSVMIESTNPFDGTELSIYYKGKNEDLFVRIELNNPSNFTINSIVIDGYKYRFTRFTDQSTNSIIYFYMSTGSTLEDTIYSVDEIIYQDGDNTKTVLVSENNEFKVYVYKDAPTIERENYSLDRDSISIDFNTIDVDNVIATNSLIVELYSGETKVTNKILAVGQTNVEFTGLLSDHNYEVKVIVDYNLDDSNGDIDDVLLYSGAFATLANALPSATITNLEVSSNSIVFDVVYHDDNEVTSSGGLSVAVFNGDILVRQTQITGSVELLVFEDLLNDTEYTLKVLSDYNLNDGHGVLVNNVLALNVFLTLPRIVPEPRILNLSVEENRVLFDLEIDDPLDLINETTLVAKLYVDDILVETANIREYSVDFEVYNFFSNYDFVIEIEASYDLNDGKGIQTDMVIFSEMFTTLQNAIPSVVVEDIIVTQGYVTVYLEVFDDNDTLKSALTAILYEGVTPVATIQFGIDDTELVLGYLVRNSEVYSLEITADYNLRDGLGTVDDYLMFRSILVSQEPKAPAAELINIVSTNNDITLDVNFMDADNTVAAGSITVYLYLEGVLKQFEVLAVGTQTVVFSGLLSNNEYEIIVTSDYNLDDGSGLQVDQVQIVGNITTLEKTIPVGIVGSDLRKTTESIIFDINVEDPDGVIETGTLIAMLYLQDVPTGDEIALDVGPNFDITFAGLLSNTIYEVRIIVAYDLDDGQGIISEYELTNTSIRSVAKDVPTAVISDVSPDKGSITFNVDITDYDDVIQVGTLKALLYIGTTATGDEVVLNVGENFGVIFDGILSDTAYRIKIVTDYYLNDNEAIEEDYQLDRIDTRTVEKDMIYAEEIYDVVLGKTVITFSVDIYDDDLIHTTNLQAVLYKDGTATGDVIPLEVGSNIDKAFTGLLADSNYIIRVETDYDKNDGEGEILAEVLRSYEAITNPLVNPSAVITIITLYDTEIKYEVNVTDSDDTVTNNLKAVLYKDGVATGAEEVLVVGDNTNLFFTGLEFGQEYVIKVETDYNLNSGEADITSALLTSETATTHQIIIVSDVTEDKKQIIFKVETDDEFGIITSNNLEVQLFDLNGIAVGDTITISLTSGVLLMQLYSDNDYYVEISATYNLGTGDVTEVVYTHEFHSVALDIPSILINRDPYHIADNPGGLVITSTTIDLEIEVADDLDGVIVGTLKAYIYANGDEGTVIQEIILVPGTNNIQFTGLDTDNNSYQILIRADANFNYDGTVTTLYIFDEITFIEAN